MSACTCHVCGGEVRFSSKGTGCQCYESCCDGSQCGGTDLYYLYTCISDACGFSGVPENTRRYLIRSRINRLIKLNAILTPLSRQFLSWLREQNLVSGDVINSEHLNVWLQQFQGDITSQFRQTYKELESLNVLFIKGESLEIV